MRAGQIALGGVLAALAVVFLMLGGLVPMATYACPMLASILLVPLREELPKPMCAGWYVIVSVLAILLCPDKETAFVFVFLGWYPLLKPTLDRLPGLPRILVKLLVFLAAVAALYAVLIYALGLEVLAEEAKNLGLAMVIALAVLGCLTFLLFDLVLGRLTILYRKRKKK